MRSVPADTSVAQVWISPAACARTANIGELSSVVFEALQKPASCPGFRPEINVDNPTVSDAKESRCAPRAE